MTRYAIQLDVDPRARPLLNVGSARQEQGFDVSPGDPRLDWVSEDRIQGLAVLPPHTSSISKFDIILRRRSRPRGGESRTTGEHDGEHGLGSEIHRARESVATRLPVGTGHSAAEGGGDRFPKISMSAVSESLTLATILFEAAKEANRTKNIGQD